MHNNIAPSYPSVATSSGAFCGTKARVRTTKKTPEEVVTDGYEGAIYVQCGQRWPNSLRDPRTPLVIFPYFLYDKRSYEYSPTVWL